jgi:hypothetical protein
MEIHFINEKGQELDVCCKNLATSMSTEVWPIPRINETLQLRGMFWKITDIIYEFRYNIINVVVEMQAPDINS